MNPALITALQTCQLIREPIIDTWRFLITKIEECVVHEVPEIIEEIDHRQECEDEATRVLFDCFNECPPGDGGCQFTCVLDHQEEKVACAAETIERIVIRAAKTVTQCVLRRGVIDSNLVPGDILLFDSKSVGGHSIDMATCSYGYSRIGLVCGPSLIDGSTGAITTRPNEYANREPEDRPVAVRLGLTLEQADELCTCVRNALEEAHDRSDRPMSFALACGTR